jgi:hypothetical protein
MRIKKLLSDLRAIEDRGMQPYWQDNWDCSCPCFFGRKNIGKEHINVVGLCWRVSESTDAQDLYIWGTVSQNILEIVGNEVKRALDAQKWYSPYKLIFEDYDGNYN